MSFFYIQGCLAPIKVIICQGSLLQPSQNAAVVGGNVLTSQRVVDVIFRAFEVCAASQVRKKSPFNHTFVITWLRFTKVSVRVCVCLRVYVSPHILHVLLLFYISVYCDSCF